MVAYEDLISIFRETHVLTAVSFTDAHVSPIARLISVARKSKPKLDVTFLSNYDELVVFTLL